MSLVRRFPEAQPDNSVRPTGRAHGPGWPVAEPALSYQRLCRLADCPADFAASGGVATGTDVADRLRDTVRQPVSALAHWIVERQVIAFSCGAGLWLPLFQFDFAQGCVRNGIAPAISELAAVMTDSEIAHWFVQPNGWLTGAAPAEKLLTNVAAVLAAARADRYVANG